MLASKEQCASGRNGPAVPEMKDYINAINNNDDQRAAHIMQTWAKLAVDHTGKNNEDNAMPGLQCSHHITSTPRNMLSVWKSGSKADQSGGAR